MPKGLPISYIKKWGISKLAWKKFRAGALSKGVPTRTASIKKRLKGEKSMGKKGKRRSSGMTIPIAPVLGLVAGLAIPAELAMRGDYNNAMVHAVLNYTGYSIPDNKWNPAYLLRGVAPLVLGLLVHKYIGGPPLNLNRTLGRAKIPLLRI